MISNIIKMLSILVIALIPHMESIESDRETLTESYAMTWESIELCNNSPIKSYEDGSMITDPTSMAYQVMSTLEIDERGHYIDTDGYIAMALGNHYGSVGDRFRITLDTGVVIYAVMADTKADVHMVNQCAHIGDGSMIEMIIDTETAGNYYGWGSNGYVLNGNYNNTEEFNGNIIKIEKELNENEKSKIY